MEIYDMEYQSVIFAQIEDIQPIPKTISYFLEAFSDKGLIPNISQEITPSGSLKRLNLTSSDDAWTIGFSSYGIGVKQMNTNIGVSNFVTKKQFISDLKEILKKIFAEFPKKSNRLGFMSGYIVDKLSEEELSNCFKSYNNPVGTYKDNPPIEWSQRIVTRKELEFNNNSELCNIISGVNQINGNIHINSKTEQSTLIQLGFNLNTFEDNTEFRFELGQIEGFYDSIITHETKLKDDFYERILPNV